MIQEVITHLNQILDGMPYFSENYGLCELKPKQNKGGEVVVPVQYIGGKWVQVPTNKYGLTYWRKTSDVTIEGVESFSQCDVDYEHNFSLRLFAMTKRSQFPEDDAYSGERLAATLVKGLALTGGNLKRQIKARHLAVRPSVYSTDTPQLISDEFSGIKPNDFKHVDLVVAIEVDITIIMRQPCMTDACNYVPQFCLKLESKVAIDA